jgi:DNA-directed RNA polymerase subunit RPC12/RpoP/predicted RNA methylase
MNDLYKDQKAADGPIECLGVKFPSDQARRAYFLKLLAEKLKDPMFRKQEGFPKGNDEAILAMSNPPYYTACPNPFLEDFIERFGTPYDPEFRYEREPLAIDVSVGKFDGLYKAHSYHTKVPHLAIVPSILHYTKPGDVVLDGFCGSGMTGVATQWCGIAPSDYRREIEAQCRMAGRPLPEWGPRKSVLADLSPAATFIAANYNAQVDIDSFEVAAKKILSDFKREFGWMYETNVPGKGKVFMEYTVWSEVFICHACSGEIIFERVAVDRETFKIHDEIRCPHCGVEGRKEEMDLQYESKLDPFTGKLKQLPKRVPTEIYYKEGSTLKAKTPDAEDLAILSRIAQLSFPPEFPNAEFPDSQMLRVGRMTTTKVNSISDLYVPRAAQTMAALWRKADTETNVDTRRFLRFMVEQAIWGLSALNRYQPSQHLNYGGSQVNRQLNGVYYIASMYAECSPWHNLDGKVSRLASAFRKYSGTNGASIVSTGSASHIPISSNCIDYIFTDPPFGENIYYADLNFLVESWHGVITDSKAEAIIDRVRQNKALPEYQRLMQRCFAEYYRVLKPGRWMTVVFSNSKASVWNAIQVALQQTGFVVAEVSPRSTRFKGSYRRWSSTNAVKQDLVISAYKPNGGLEQRLAESAAPRRNRPGISSKPTWATHCHEVKDGALEFIVERDPRRIYDRLGGLVRATRCSGTAVERRVPGRSSQQLPGARWHGVPAEQVAVYDKKRAQVAQAPQMELFVSDERSAIDWLSDFLKQRPPPTRSCTPSSSRSLGPVGRSTRRSPSFLRCLETTSSSTTALAMFPARSTATSRRTTRICAVSTRASALLPRPRTAGTCRTRTRRRTWRRSARRRC